MTEQQSWAGSLSGSAPVALASSVGSGESTRPTAAQGRSAAEGAGRLGSSAQRGVPCPETQAHGGDRDLRGLLSAAPTPPFGVQFKMECIVNSNLCVSRSGCHVRQRAGKHRRVRDCGPREPGEDSERWKGGGRLVTEDAGAVGGSRQDHPAEGQALSAHRV